VWAGVHDSDPLARETAHLVVGGRSVSGIWAQDPDGELHAIDAVVREITPRDPAVRLVRDGHTVVPIGTDPGGHLQRRIDRGELHELTPAERESYYAGEAG
jgi:hypothetical protein